MIGVRAHPADEDVVREFFELFKTPWEFEQGGRFYDVWLSTTGELPVGVSAKVIVVYSGQPLSFDQANGVEIADERTGSVLRYGVARRVPIYGRALTFGGPDIGLLTEERPRRAAACVVQAGDPLVIRLGYDLVREVRLLLTEGQPAAHAGIPTLDEHVALLRELIAWSGVSIVEIPPVPDGYRFVACLTHDVDHPAIRLHRWDHTTLGFLLRAGLGSLAGLCRGRRSIRDVLVNWAAALRLPLVHLGIARDFWRDLRRYLALDPGAACTFYVIPRKGYAGQTSEGQAPPRRAAAYGARDIAADLRALRAAGCEIGVHGLDAWLDTESGRQELAEIATITGASEVGIRMHWLYGSEKSAAIVEQAGFAYDSTSGYNETVGYRAGTSQVFKPLGAASLLELPLHVMDTALFHPTHLDLSPPEARRVVRQIIDHARRSGGTVTVNWHDRSLAPERLWGVTYRTLVDDLARQQAWFARASQAVAWFRQRRAAEFEAVSWEPHGVRVRVTGGAAEQLPALRLRLVKARARDGRPLGDGRDTDTVDATLLQGTEACLAF